MSSCRDNHELGKYNAGRICHSILLDWLKCRHKSLPYYPRRERITVIIFSMCTTKHRTSPSTEKPNMVPFDPSLAWDDVWNNARWFINQFEIQKPTHLSCQRVVRFALVLLFKRTRLCKSTDQILKIAIVGHLRRSHASLGKMSCITVNWSVKYFISYRIFHGWVRFIFQ